MTSQWERLASGSPAESLPPVLGPVSTSARKLVARLLSQQAVYSVSPVLMQAAAVGSKRA